MENTLQTNSDVHDEPVGIVIAGGSLPEQAPRLWAYVWGQDEEGLTPTELAVTG